MSLAQYSELADVIASIQSCSDKRLLEEAVLKALLRFGFDGFIMSVNAKDKYSLLEPELTSFPKRFFIDYASSGFIDIDPIIANSLIVNTVFSWTTTRIPRDVRDKKLLEYLRAVPLARGMVIPLPSMPGRISTANICSRNEVTFDAETVLSISIVARVAMMKLESFGLCAGDGQARLVDADLTLRQVEVLNWAVQGKSNSDIAVIMAMSKRAIDYHMSEILRELKVSTRMQAIALATRRHERG